MEKEDTEYKIEFVMERKRDSERERERERERWREREREVLLPVERRIKMKIGISLINEER